MEAYEQRFGTLLGGGQVVAFSYARTALSAIFTSLDLQRGDEVIVSSLTCKAVPLTLLSLGLTPVYADISANTLNMRPDTVAKAIGPSTRAVLFQHTYGHSAGIESVAALAASRGIPLIEDCAQCLPAAGRNGMPGRHGRAAIFSNNTRKPLPAGSGGLAVTQDERLGADLRAYRDRLPRCSKRAEQTLRMERWVHRYVVRPRLYWTLFELNRRFDASYHPRPVKEEIEAEIKREGFQISEGQAAAGLRWLDRVQPTIAHRLGCCIAYADALRTLSTITIPFPIGDEPLYYLPVLTERKEALLTRARKRHIELIAWPVRTPIFPIETEEILPAYGYQPGSCPVAEDVARRLVGLPTAPSIRARHRARLIELLHSTDQRSLPMRTEYIGNMAPLHGAKEALIVADLDEAQAPQWRCFVERRQDANLYHTLIWRDVIQQVFGHRPVYLCCKDQQGICGILPMFLIKWPILGAKLVSMPYDIGSGGVLADDEAVERLLVEEAIRRAEQFEVNYLELRYATPRPVLNRIDLVPRSPVVLSEMDLSTEEEVWDNVYQDHRKSIRKAKNRGVSVRLGDELEDFKTFYSVYLRVFRDFGTPPYSFDYFQTVWQRLQPSGAVRLFLAYVDERCVGGLVLYCWQKNLVSKFSVCLPEAVPHRTYHALYWEAIRFGLQHGYRKLSWGSSALNQTGLIDFKERWGAQSHSAVIYDRAVRKEAPDVERYFDAENLPQRIWKNLPVPVTRLFGGLLNRWYC